MDLESSIERHKKTIVKRWVAQVIQTYPSETAAVFSKEKDKFANPVAGSLSVSLGKVVDGLISDAPPQELSAAIDPAIRVRAVQNFTCSAAVEFIFFLKKIIPDVIGPENIDTRGWARLDKIIQKLALIGFDKYVECREKIFELRASDLRNRTFRAFERAGLVVDPGAVS